MFTPERPVIIIGAGVSGLVLAQGLKHRGIPFKLFERDVSLTSRSQGYRFRCENPGLEALEETVSPEIWALLDKTHAKNAPANFTVLNPHTSEKIRETAPGQDLSSREQRCWPIDRPWFRELLMLGLEDDVVFGKSFEAYELLPEEDGRSHVRVHFNDSSTLTGSLLVSSEGVRSRVRRQRLPEIKLVDVDRMVLWGRTHQVEDVLSKMPPQIFATGLGFAIDQRHPTRSTLWQVCKWPGDLHELSDGKLSPRQDYIFWVISTEADQRILAQTASSDDLLGWIDTVTAEWDPALRVMFQNQDPSELAVSKIYSSCPDLPQWETHPCIALLGDAIHCMAPTGGAGGLTAIIDARDLCMAIASAVDEPQGAWTERLRKCEQEMRTRAAEMVERAFKNAKMLWAGKDWWEYERNV